MPGTFEYGQNLFLDAVLGRGTVPTQVKIGLLTDSPDNDDDTLDEPVGGGYSRITVNNDTSFWSTASNGLKFSLQGVTFPTATADWGLITHYFISDASTGFGILWGEFNEPIYVAAGQGVVIDSGMLSISASDPEVSIVL